MPAAFQGFRDRFFAHSIICHNILIKAWGRSRLPDSVQRAEQILKSLEEGYRTNKDNIRPDITTYSSVINCCAYYYGNSDGRKEVFEVALRTFDKIKETGEGPNNVTFGTLFKAISKLTLMDQSREILVEKFFHQCCQEGQVDSFVIAQVRAGIPISLYRKLVLAPSSLNDNDVNNIDKILQNMPKEWGKNVFVY
jgi:hypothetical protein